MSTWLLFLAVLAAATNGAKGAAVRLTDTRIVGGESTTIEEYPFQVSLVYFSSHRCGGAIISENYVVTAAHCVNTLTTNLIPWLKIRIGSSYRNTGGTLHDISSFTYHPSYNETTYDYDIAVIRVTHPFEFSASVQPIEIPEANYEIEDGLEVSVTGFGRLSYLGSSPDDLQVVTVPIINGTQCAEYYNEFGGITDRMICAGYEEGGKDACQGDSGGPLSYGNILLGLVSWGYGCAYPSYPGVYTKVPLFRDWLYELSGIIF